LHQAVQVLMEAKQAPREAGEKLSAALFSRVIRIASARGEVDQAVDLLDEMRDDHDLEPDAPTYLAAIEACEGRQPLERVWLILDEMRKQGLDPDSLAPSSQDAADGMPPLRFQASSAQEDLRRHAEVWLVDAPPIPRKAFQAAVTLASALRRQGTLPAAAEAAVRRRIITPVVEALRGPAAVGSAEAAILGEVHHLGEFTEDALEELSLGPGAVQWQGAARAELRRQALLRAWAAWEEATGPGLLTWLAYDLSGGSGQAWELQSTGEAFGLSPGADALDDVSVALLPPLARDESAGHAERRALLALTERIFGQFPEGSCEGERVEGVVMLYSTRPPCVASIFAIKQFLRFFPWVRFCTSCGGPEPQVTVERIGEAVNGAKHGSEQSWSKWSSWQSKAQTNGSGGWGSGYSTTGTTNGASNGYSTTGTTNGASNGNATNGNGHGSWNQWV